MQVSAAINGVKVTPHSQTDLIAENFKDSLPSLVGKLKDLDNDNTSIVEYFASNTYVREMVIPAGTCVVGRVHKADCINILLEGEIVIVDNDGNRKEMSAPQVFIAKAGHQKAGYALKDTRWLNCFSCEEEHLSDVVNHFTVETEEEYMKLLENKL